MSDDKKHPGLGEVIYSVENESNAKEPETTDEEVTEAAEESFPASDPPAYSGASADPE